MHKDRGWNFVSKLNCKNVGELLPVNLVEDTGWNGLMVWVRLRQLQSMCREAINNVVLDCKWIVIVREFTLHTLISRPLSNPLQLWQYCWKMCWSNVSLTFWISRSGIYTKLCFLPHSTFHIHKWHWCPGTFNKK